MPYRTRVYRLVSSRVSTSFVHPQLIRPRSLYRAEQPVRKGGNHKEVINVVHWCDNNSAGSLDQMCLKKERKNKKMKATLGCTSSRHTGSVSFNMRIRPYVLQSCDDVSRCSFLNIPSPRLYCQYNWVTTGRRKTSPIGYSAFTTRSFRPNQSSIFLSKKRKMAP